MDLPRPPLSRPRSAARLPAVAAAMIAMLGAGGEAAAPIVDRPMGQALGLGMPPSTPHAVTCPAGETVFGIDVSKWQGEIDWAAVADSGVRYAFIRASHGTGIIDEWFDVNWQQARAHGVLRGVYQYFEPAQDPIAQADLMLDMMGELQPGDLPPVIDVESNTDSTPPQTAAAVQAWVDHVEAATGVQPIIYTGRYFWQDHVASDAFVDYPLWIAHYTDGCPNIPDPWTTWAFHQYSSTGSVPGIAGNVDTNDFNGSYEDLLAMTVPHSEPAAAVDLVSCDRVTGWALDPGAPEAALAVLVSYAGPSIEVAADRPHATACDDAGGCDHGFAAPVPFSRHDGRDHAVAIEVVDRETTVAGAPATLHCALPDLAAVRVRPLDDAAAIAWGVDPSWHVLDLDALGEPGPDREDVAFPDQPLLVQAEGDDAVWLVDRGVRRAMDATVAAAWGLSLGEAMSWPPASVAEIPVGTPLPASLQVIASGGRRFVLDTADDVAGDDDGPGDDGPDDGPGDDGADDHGGADDGGGADAPAPGFDRGEDGTGCRVAAPDGRAWAWLLLLGLRRLRRRSAARPRA
jgi:GH25 family lysozyme M1 (1,4-beta-N-acetylmuramidase)